MEEDQLQYNHYVRVLSDLNRLDDHLYDKWINLRSKVRYRIFYLCCEGLKFRSIKILISYFYINNT